MATIGPDGFLDLKFSGSDPLVAALNLIVDAHNATRIVSVSGGTVDRRGGVSINCFAGSAGTSSNIVETPFFVRVRPKPNSTANEWQAQVVADSVLLITQLPVDNMAVDGIAEWFDIDLNDAIYLHISYDEDGDPETAQILSTGDTDWDTTLLPLPVGNESYVQYTGTEPNIIQSEARLMIAIISPDNPDADPSDQKAESEQIITSYLQIVDRAINGYAAKIPVQGGAPDLGSLNFPRPDDVP